ncbi:MAG: insulinase family protein [Candidatus Desulfatibia sp.]|uniref:M16 family metallopeptidase n=1 Tax=Candidatus Desulfatibia sp. TaxID=3101189 RepID=UPI002F2E2A6E
MSKKRLGPFISRFCTWAAIIGTALFFFSGKLGVGNTGSSFFFQNSPIHLSIATAAAEQIDALNEWPHEKSNLLPDPVVVFGKLKNEFRYVLMENHKPKGRVSMHLNVQAGSTNESDSQQGLAHFLEHMLFNGSTNFKPGELVKYFQSIGMQFGPDANAYTGFNKTVYDILLPEGSREGLEQGLVVMQDYAEGALLLQSEVARERRVVLAEKRTRDSASYRTHVATMKFEFPDSRISKRLPIGVEKVLRNADSMQFKAFYNTWYRPEKMILVMVGDFDIKLAPSLIEERFSSLSPRAPPEPQPDLGPIHHNGVKSFYHFEQETGNTQISVEVIKKIPRKPDSLALQSSLLTANVADRIVQNRLDRLVGKPNTPFTSAAISSGIFLHQIKYADIAAESSPENWEKSLALIEQTLRQALEHGFAKSELERVKKNILSELDQAVKKAPTRNSRNLARRIIWSLNADRVFMSPSQKKELLTPLLKSMTLKNVADAFKKTWSPNHRLVLVTGNTDLTGRDQKPEQQILATYNRSHKVQVSRPPASKAVMFPYLAEPAKAGRIVRRSTLSDLGVVRIDFENGVRLNLKKTDFEANEVLVKLAFGMGRSAEPVDKAGLASLSTMVINESGLGTLDKDDIELALAGKNTTVNFSVGEDRFYFTGTTVPEEVPLLFQLLYAHLVDPGFREDAYTLSMERLKQQHQRRASSIEGAMVLTGKRFLAGGDSRFGLPGYKGFARLTLEHVRSWFDASLITEDIEVSIVGDFDVENVVKTASKYFGNLSKKPSPSTEKSSRSPQFPVNQSLLIPVETEIPKGLVVIAYPSEDLWDIGRTRRFAILANIVSDELREKVREKLGAAYSAFAFNSPKRAYPGYGVFQVMIHVDPEEVDMVVGVVKKLIADLAENGASQDALRRAVNPTLTSIKDMKRKNGYWLNTVLNGSEQHPQQFEWSRTIMPDYASITKEEVSALARQYLDNSKAVVIIVKPKKKSAYHADP